jgi:hypothetical protein
MLPPTDTVQLQKYDASTLLLTPVQLYKPKNSRKFIVTRVLNGLNVNGSLSPMPPKKKATKGGMDGDGACLCTRLGGMCISAG